MGEHRAFILMCAGIVAVYAVACVFQTMAGPTLSPLEKIAQVCKRHYSGVDEQQCEAKLLFELTLKLRAENSRAAGNDEDQIAREAGVR